MTPTTGAPEARPRRRRLQAAERKSLILGAARKAFSASGDMNGTTMREIAQRGGISEAIIYRHFESKEQLFYEAVVEPLRDAIDEVIAVTATVDAEQPLTTERQLSTLERLYRELTNTFDEVLPLLGLVLFGDPKQARRFYSEHLATAIDRLAETWSEVERRNGHEHGAPDVAARMVIGAALMLAIEKHNAPKTFDGERLIGVVSEVTRRGFLPSAAGHRGLDDVGRTPPASKAKAKARATPAKAKAKATAAKATAKATPAKAKAARPAKPATAPATKARAQAKAKAGAPAKPTPAPKPAGTAKATPGRTNRRANGTDG